MAEFFPATAAAALIFKTTEEGYAAGNVADPDNVSSASEIVTSGALYVPYIIDFDSPQPTYSELSERSGQRVRMKVQTGVSDISSFTTNSSRFIDELTDLSHDVGTNTTFWSGATIGGAELSPTIFNNLGLVLFQQIYVPTGAGVESQYAAYIYPSTQIVQGQPGGSQAEGENPNPIPWTITPSSGSVFPTGTDLADISNVGYESGQTLMVKIVRPEKFHIQTAWLSGDVGDVTFKLDYLPTSSDATSGGDNLVTINGVVSAVTSVNTTTGVVTLSSPGTEGDIVVVMYPTNFVPSPA